MCCWWWNKTKKNKINSIDCSALFARTNSVSLCESFFFHALCCVVCFVCSLHIGMWASVEVTSRYCFHSEYNPHNWHELNSFHNIQTNELQQHNTKHTHTHTHSNRLLLAIIFRVRKMKNEFVDVIQQACVVIACHAKATENKNAWKMKASLNEVAAVCSGSRSEKAHRQKHNEIITSTHETICVHQMHLHLKPNITSSYIDRSVCMIKWYCWCVCVCVFIFRYKL